MLPISDDNVQNFFEEAQASFLNRERANILNRVAERNLCARLAFYLESLSQKYGFKNYFTDPEYNKKQSGSVKTILDDDMKVTDIQSDIVFHSRGEDIQNDNILAIEMKKSNRTQSEKDSDRNRLRAMTKESYDNIWSNDGTIHPEHVCGYLLGVYMEININKKSILVEYYRKGNLSHEYILDF